VGAKLGLLREYYLLRQERWQQVLKAEDVNLRDIPALAVAAQNILSGNSAARSEWSALLKQVAEKADISDESEDAARQTREEIINQFNTPDGIMAAVEKNILTRERARSIIGGYLSLEVSRSTFSPNIPNVESLIKTNYAEKLEQLGMDPHDFVISVLSHSIQCAKRVVDIIDRSPLPEEVVYPK
jgi:hypothetical protein